MKYKSDASGSEIKWKSIWPGGCRTNPGVAYAVQSQAVSWYFFVQFASQEHCLVLLKARWHL